MPLDFWKEDAAGRLLLVVPGVVAAAGVEPAPAVAATVGVGICTMGCGVELKLPLL